MLKKIAQGALGLFGLSIVIIIHEFGHLIAAKAAGVPAPLFSIGFGPVLIAVRLGATIYQICMLPLGGYVMIPQDAMDAAPYLTQIAILSAGVAANFIFAYLILFIFKLRKVNLAEMIATATQNAQSGVMGPIGIISLISYSATLGISYFFLVLGTLSMSIGIFNLFPIPFLDGGQIVWYTIQAVAGPLPDTAYNLVSKLFFVLLLLFLFFVSAKDIRFLKR